MKSYPVCPSASGSFPLAQGLRGCALGSFRVRSCERGLFWSHIPVVSPVGCCESCCYDCCCASTWFEVLLSICSGILGFFSLYLEVKLRAHVGGNSVSRLLRDHGAVRQLLHLFPFPPKMLQRSGFSVSSRRLLFSLSVRLMMEIPLRVNGQPTVALVGISPMHTGHWSRDDEHFFMGSLAICLSSLVYSRQVLCPPVS